MIKYLKELLEDLKKDDYILFKEISKKILALETAIEILENIKKGDE